MVYEDELSHHGILGQKWGVRRYQNPDGTLTAEGKERLKNDRAKLDERQSRASRWESKAQNRANKYNAANRKLVNYPFERPIKKFAYDWSNFGHDRALNSANRWYKKVSKRYKKMGIDALSESQIKKGEEFMNWAASNNMLQANMTSQMANMQRQINKMK